MSESSIFPGPDDGTVAGVPLDDGDADANDGANRRKLMMVGGAAGVVIVLAAAYFILHSGSSSSPTAGAPVPVVQTSSPAAGSHGASHKAGRRRLPKVARQADVRDPFTALITAPVDTGTAPQSTTTVSASPSPSASTPSDSSSPVVVITSPPASPSPSASTPQWIRLLGVHRQTATFDVGYPGNKFRQFVVTAPKPSATSGTVFDKIFTLIGVESGQKSDELATIQIGDASPFDLPTGVSHSV